VRSAEDVPPNGTGPGEPPAGDGAASATGAASDVSGSAGSSERSGAPAHVAIAADSGTADESGSAETSAAARNPGSTNGMNSAAGARSVTATDKATGTDVVQPVTRSATEAVRVEAPGSSPGPPPAQNGAARQASASSDGAGPSPVGAMANPNAPAGAPNGATAAASTAVASSPEDSVPQQVLTVLNPLRTGDDGSQSVTLALQPEGLGNVQATLSVVGEQVSVSLWADSATGHAALSQTMSQLHSQLSDGSERQVTVDLADFGSAQPDPRQGHASNGHGTTGVPAHDYLPDDNPTVQPVPLSGGRRVDLRL
jgi:flagellar hook-length control protein FliK